MLVGSKYIDLVFRNKIQARWKAQEKALNRIKESFVNANSQDIGFVQGFVESMDRHFERVTNSELKNFGHLHLLISSTENGWNLTLTKYGLLIHTFTSGKASNVIRKQNISFDQF